MSDVYVFISYKSEDMADAERLREILESQGIECWMAPKSIPLGMDYSDVIAKSVKGSSVFLLLLTEKTQSSKNIKSELRFAFDASVPIIYINTQNVRITEGFNYYLGNSQGVSAHSISADDEGVKDTVNGIKNLLAKKRSDAERHAEPKPHMSSEKKVEVVGEVPKASTDDKVILLQFNADQKKWSFFKMIIAAGYDQSAARSIITFLAVILLAVFFLLIAIASGVLSLALPSVILIAAYVYTIKQNYRYVVKAKYTVTNKHLFIAIPKGKHAQLRTYDLCDIYNVTSDTSPNKLYSGIKFNYKPFDKAQQKVIFLPNIPPFYISHAWLEEAIKPYHN